MRTQEDTHTREASILVVEDDPGTCRSISAALEAVGHSARTAANYAEAVECVREESPLAAVISVELPGPSGYDVFKRLRDDFGDGVPVIFLSEVRTEPFDRVAGLLAGGDDYVVKPFDAEELVARVTAVLRRVTRD